LAIDRDWLAVGDQTHKSSRHHQQTQDLRHQFQITFGHLSQHAGQRKPITCQAGLDQAFRSVWSRKTQILRG